MMLPTFVCVCLCVCAFCGSNFLCLGFPDSNCSQNVIEYIVKAVVDIEDSDGTQITDNEFIGDEGAGMM